MALLTNIQFFSLLIVGVVILLYTNFIKSKPQPLQKIGSLTQLPFFKNNRLLSLSTSGVSRPLPFQLIGIVHSSDPNEDTILNLWGRKYYRDTNRYQYRIEDTDKNLFIRLNEGEPMKELYSGDVIQIPQLSGVGDFVVEINKKEFI